MHQQELENMTLATQPFETIKFFTLAIIQYMKQTILYLLAKGGWLVLFIIVVGALGIMLMAIDGVHDKVLAHILSAACVVTKIVSLGSL